MSKDIFLIKYFNQHCMYFLLFTSRLTCCYEKRIFEFMNALYCFILYLCFLAQAAEALAGSIAVACIFTDKICKLTFRFYVFKIYLPSEMLQSMLYVLLEFSCQTFSLQWKGVLWREEWVVQFYILSMFTSPRYWGK